VSKSEVVRQAIELLASQERQTPFERVADLIGCVQGGPPDLSEATGTRFRQLLANRKR
jgi:Arc/MetJ-type ribon-helix-helix transcriptional regulator